MSKNTIAQPSSDKVGGERSQAYLKLRVHNLPIIIIETLKYRNITGIIAKINPFKLAG